MNKLIFIFLLLPFICVSQISFSEENIDLGFITEAYEIKGDLVLTNTSAKKIFLMRADADKGVKIYTSKKTLLPGDTCLLVISFIPENNGRFKKKIQIISSDRGTPYELNLSGTLAHVKANDRMACVYFGKRKDKGAAVKNEPIIVPENTAKRDNSNKLPDSAETPVVKTAEKPKATPENNMNDFSELNYGPNNILFLVDISSSMRDSLKLPVMKTALHKLIDAVREIDIITFVTYASKVKIVEEAMSGADKKTLHSIVDSLRSKGVTAGNTAILFSQQLAQKHYIKNGNNQIIIATDGKFKFEREDFIKWKERQMAKKIILSTVAFGKDKTAIQNLKEIAYKGEGSFIYIDQKNGDEEKLLDEIKLRSRRQ